MLIPFNIGGDPLGYTYIPAETAEQIINAAAVEVGLATATNPYTSTDPNFIALRQLLKSLGRKLWRERNWAHLSREHSFDTELDVQAYVLPPDFGRMVDQTGWNQTSGQPLGGPQTPQEWQLQASSLLGGIGIRVSFRPWKGQLYLSSGSGATIAANQTIQFEYISKWWVQPAAVDTANTDEPTASTDKLWFDPMLLVTGLKLAWKQAKGFDTTADQLDFDRMLMQSMGDDAASPTIRLGGRGTALGLFTLNVPDTGYGQ